MLSWRINLKNMRIAEQIKEGQYRANKIIKEANLSAEDFKKQQIALFTFIEEVEAGIEKLREKYIENKTTDSHAA